MLITNEEMEKILQDAKANLHEQTMIGVKERVLNAMSFSLEKGVNAQVDLFVNQELAPAIGRILAENKPIMLEAAVKSANEIAVVISAALVQRVVDTMGNNYKRDRLFKALFGD